MIELPGGWRVLDADECATLAAQEYRLRRSWRGDGLMVPVPLAELLADLAAAADARVTARDGAGPALVPSLVAGAANPESSSWPSTEAAARTLGISTSAVRKAIRSGRLVAVQDREGTGYRVHPESLATYEPRSTGDRRAAGDTNA